MGNLDSKLLFKSPYKSRKGFTWKKGSGFKGGLRAWRNISSVFSFLRILFSLTIPSFTVLFGYHKRERKEQWCQLIEQLGDEPVMTKSHLYTSKLLQCTKPWSIQHRTKRDILRNLHNRAVGINSVTLQRFAAWDHTTTPAMPRRSLLEGRWD